MKGKKKSEPLTEARIVEILEELTIGKKREREFVMIQGCKTHGSVQRDSSNLNICGDETCVSCQGMAEALNDNIKNLFKDEEE